MTIFAMQMKRTTLAYNGFLIAVMLLIGSGCAQQGSPTGGPVDEDPPVVLKSSPENFSTRFDQNRITITFNEYLDMANFTQELVVSPPMAEKPEIRLKNKTLIIEFEEEMKEEVTYTFNFGEGIRDLNEGNVLLNYEYVFSTGDYLDSLSVKGTLKNAFDLSVPEAPVNVMLYTSLEDSLPLTQIPYYVGRMDEKGNFAVNNLKPGIYKLFVLKDGNNNFLFDLPSEQIAFLDTSLFIDPVFFRKTLISSGMADSADLVAGPPVLDIDTTGMPADSIAMVIDSLKRSRPDFNTLYLDLYMFTEAPVNQFISGYERKERNLLEVLFNLPVTDRFVYSTVYPDSLNNQALIPEFGINRDTLKWWLADTLISKLDTIGLALDYQVLDTLGLPMMKRDTLQFAFRDKSKGKKQDKPIVDKTLKVTTIRTGGKHHILKDIGFILPDPLGAADPEKFELYIIPDSVEIPVEAIVSADTANIRRARLSHPWKEEANYRMLVYPGGLTNIYGLTNDTIDIRFSIRPLAEYGRINLDLEDVKDTILVQLYGKSRVMAFKTVTLPGPVQFDFVEPGTYQIKLIHDRNGNGKWDTGDYQEGLQPEKVEYIPKELEIRANWDHDITYVMGSNLLPPQKANEEEEGPVL